MSYLFFSFLWMADFKETIRIRLSGATHNPYTLTQSQINRTPTLTTPYTPSNFNQLLHRHGESDNFGIFYIPDAYNIIACILIS
jgi:hypothetical protein